MNEQVTEKHITILTLDIFLCNNSFFFFLSLPKNLRLSIAGLMKLFLNENKLKEVTCQKRVLKVHSGIQKQKEVWREQLRDRPKTGTARVASFLTENPSSWPRVGIVRGRRNESKRRPNLYKMPFKGFDIKGRCVALSLNRYSPDSCIMCPHYWPKKDFAGHRVQHKQWYPITWPDSFACLNTISLWRKNNLTFSVIRSSHKSSTLCS